MINLTWKPLLRPRKFIYQMDDRHLDNSINMIKRGHDCAGRPVAPFVQHKLPLLEQERDYRALRTYINELWG